MAEKIEELEDEPSAGALYTKTVSIRLSPDQLTAFKRAAKHTGVPTGSLMRVKLLENFDWERWVAARPPVKKL